MMKCKGLFAVLALFAATTIAVLAQPADSGRLFVGNAFGLTNASPNIATNFASATDNQMLIKTGDKVKWTNAPSGGGGGSNAKIHANVAQVTAVAGSEATLLDGTSSLLTTLSAGSVIVLDARGYYEDTDGNMGLVTFKMKVGPTTTIFISENISDEKTWHLQCTLTARTTGALGVLMTSATLIDGNGGITLFNISSTVDTTSPSISVGLTSTITAVSGTESTVCEQAIIYQY